MQLSLLVDLFYKLTRYVARTVQTGKKHHDGHMVKQNAIPGRYFSIEASASQPMLAMQRSSRFV